MIEKLLRKIESNKALVGVVGLGYVGLPLVRELAQRLRKGQLVVLESTTYPGTTKEVMLPILAESGLKVGKDFFLAFSPEREDPGRTNYTTKTIPKVVGGMERNSRQAAVACYEIAIDTVVPVSSCEAAEACKILENTYRCVNIALVNELKMTSRKLTAKMLAGYDAVLMSTDHGAYDYQFIVDHARLVVDTRNATAGIRRGRRKIVKA